MSFNSKLCMQIFQNRYTYTRTKTIVKKKFTSTIYKKNLFRLYVGTFLCLFPIRYQMLKFSDWENVVKNKSSLVMEKEKIKIKE